MMHTNSQLNEACKKIPLIVIIYVIFYLARTLYRT